MRLATPKFSIAGIVATLGALALLAAGCGTSTNTGPGNLAASQVFKYAESTGASGDIETLDPGVLTSAAAAVPMYLVFGGLVVLDQNEKVQPWDATSWTPSPDGLTWTFHLRSGMKWSDGTPITSSDYAYGMDRSMNPCLASPVAYYLTGQAGTELVKDSTTYNAETCNKDGTLSAAKGQTAPVIQTLVGDSITTPDPLTLQVQLSTPASYFIDAMTYPTSYPLEKSVIDANGGLASSKWEDALSSTNSGKATGQGTNGEFYIQSWDHSAGTMVLKANPNWWGKLQHITEVDFTFFKDADTAYNAYLSGQNSVNGVPSQDVAAAKSAPDFHSAPQLEFQGLQLQWSAEPFSDLAARQAACLAINRDTLNTAVFKGTQHPAYNIVPPGMPGYNKNLTGPDGVTSTAGDTAKAAQLWQQYQSEDPKAVKTFQLTYVTGSATADQYYPAIAQQIQAALPGVTVKVNPIDANTWFKLLSNGQYTGMLQDGWIADYPDPQDFTTLLFSTGAQYNVQHASVPNADSLMIAADKNTNQAQRIQQYNQAEQLLVNNVAYCGLYTAQAYYRVRTTVHGFSLNAGGFSWDGSWETMYITKS